MKNQIKKLLNKVHPVPDPKISDELLWAQIFNSTINDSSWLINKSFSPGRWAVGYPALYIIYRVLNDIKPKSILEFGLGESSKMTFQYHKSFENTELNILEQDEEWLSFFSKEKFDIRSNVTVLPIVKSMFEGFESYGYDGLLPALSNKTYDFIIIDGPWGSPKNSRFQIVEIIKNDMLADDFVILMDDFNRKGEQETVSKLCLSLKEKGVEYSLGVYSGMKDMAIICSSKFKFLISL